MSELAGLAGLAPRRRTTDREALSAARRLVGRLAPVATVFERCRRADQVDLFVHTAFLNDRVLWGRRIATPGFIGSGAALDRSRAFVAAVGECVERGFGSVPRAAATRVARRDSLGDRALDPQRFAPFAAEQLEDPASPFVAFGEHEPIPWVEGWSLCRDREFLVPSEAVHLGPHSSDPHMLATSNGLASGLRLEDAVLSGVCELIERDAFMLVWMSRFSPPEIDLDTLPDPALQALRARVAAGRARLRVFRITSDIGVPTYLAAVHGGEGEVPSAAFGAACRPGALQAAIRAAIEATHTWNWTFEVLAERGRLVRPDEEPSIDLSSFEGHVHLHAHPWRRRSTRFLLADRATVPFVEDGFAAQTTVEELAEIRRRLRERDCDVVLVDLSPEPEWDMGFRVVRALSPDLIPLSLSGVRSYRACPRYFTVPRTLGFPDPPRSPADLNRDPHPFP